MGPAGAQGSYTEGAIDMLVVLGSLNYDRTVVAERLPEPGETVTGHSYAESVGGKGGNVAAQAARLGSRVRLMGRVGQDAAGEAVRAHHAALGVDLTHLASVADLPTGTASIWVDAASGENRIVVVPGANARLDAAAVRAACAAGLLEGVSLLVTNLEVPLDAVQAAVAAAHARNVPVLLNRSPVHDFDPRALTARDLLIVNLPEARALLPLLGDSGGTAAAPGDEPMALARTLTRLTQATAIVTAGGEGVAASGPRGAVRRKAAPVTPVDTTGAGDAFLGALAAALDGGASFPDALQLATWAGAYAVTQPGAGGQGDRHAINALAAAHGTVLWPDLVT